MMNMMKLRFFIFVLILITGIANVSAEAVTLVYPSNIQGGQMFDAKVIIDPNGKAITGAQLDIQFDKSSILINSISEGNLLKQGGANTIFNSGTISNSLGKAEKIYGAILGPYNVTTSGTFIIINATAIVSTNTPDMNLTNVLVVDPQGKQIYPIPTPKQITQNQDISTASGGAQGGAADGGQGGPPGGGSVEAVQEPSSFNQTVLAIAIIGILIVFILVYKYVIPKYSATKSEIPKIGKQEMIVKTTRKKLSSIIQSEASDDSIKTIAADTKISESGIEKVRAPGSKDHDPIRAKKISKKKKENDKNTGKTTA